MKTLRILALALSIMALPLAAVAQEASKTAPEMPRVSVKAKGDDVRTVLATIFEQAKKNYVLPVNFRFALFLSLEDQPFDRVLDIVCKQTGLVAELVDGVYQVKVAPKPKVDAPAEAKTSEVKLPEVKRNVLPASVLAKRVTTRLAKADLKDVAAALSEQAEVTIEIDAKVPTYKVDAFLINTSLKYALDNLTKAAKLTYRLTDRGTILIARSDSPSTSEDRN